MSETVRVAAVDLGASSGRVVLGEAGRDVLRLHPVARFANEPVRLPDGLHWDLLGLYAAALSGLGEAVRGAEGRLASVGIDTWAVDYGLLRDGRLLGLPYHYRDERRGARGPVAVHALVPQPELYARTGLQYLPFNSVYQLAADPWVAQADRLLLLPDLLGFWLTGKTTSERTNASTTGLLDVHTGAWDDHLVDRLALPRRLLGELVDPGAIVAAVLPEVAEVIGARPPVVAVGSHDTASAVVGVPMLGQDAAYVSLGTWGLVGLELAKPVVTEAARAANFTNEGGVDGTVRFLTNVMGTWLLSESMRTWARAGSAHDLGTLLEAAAAVRGDVPVFDVQDPRFVPPGDMPARIAAWCEEQGVAPPRSPAETARSIVESLAAAYAVALDQAQELSGRRVGVVHVVGGGAQNALLCQALADRSGRPVVVGPVEATALGNVLVQARTAGLVGPGLREMRELVAATHRLHRFTPGGPSERIGG